MRLDQKIKNAIFNHAREKYPEECCGIVYNINCTFELYKCDNSHKNKETNYEISSKDMNYISEEIGDENIVLVYHSHTGIKGAYFSPTDEKEAWVLADRSGPPDRPWIVYLVVSNVKGFDELRAFKWNEDSWNFIEEGVSIV